MEFNNTTPQEQNYPPISTPIQSMVENTKKDSKVGPLIGSIIVILLVLVGGLYFWGSIITHKKAELEVQRLLQEQAKADEMANIAKQSASDETTVIEADLNATDIDSLNKGASDIKKEF